MVLTCPACCGAGHPGAMLETMLGNVGVQLEVLHVQLGHRPETWVLVSKHIYFGGFILREDGLVDGNGRNEHWNLLLVPGKAFLRGSRNQFKSVSFLSLFSAWDSH